jgi:hypothetical protein
VIIGAFAALGEGQDPKAPAVKREGGGLGFATPDKIKNPKPPTVTAGRFLSPWPVEEQPACFVESRKATTPL